MKKKIFKIFDYIKENVLIFILVSIIFSLLSPLLFTLKWNFVDFTNTGQIGDTIGGITSPFINVLNAILIYIAFTEQLKANELLKNQLDVEKNKEDLRLKKIEELIMFDITYLLIVASDIKEEIPKFFKNRASGISEAQTYMDYPELNDEVYNSIDKTDLLKIFGEDYMYIVKVYHYVDYIKKITPLNISFKYPTDRNSLALINLTDEQYESLKSRHQEKIDKELQGLLDYTLDDFIRVMYVIIRRNDELY